MEEMDDWDMEMKMMKKNLKKLDLYMVIINNSSLLLLILLLEIIFISSGGYHSAAINAKGELYTWGWNYYGQLGFESTNDHPIPTLVESFKGKKVLYVTCGEKHTLAIVQ